MGFLNVKLAGFFKYVGFLNTITATPEFSFHCSYKMQKVNLFGAILLQDGLFGAVLTFY